MKKLKIFAVIFIMLGFAVNTAKSQAYVENDFWRVLITKCGMYCAEDTHFVLTPSGNLLLTATYQLKKCDCLVPDKGVNKVDVFGTPAPIVIGDIVKFQWGFFILEDIHMIVTSNGRAKIVYHFKLCPCVCK
jgi:hypothetical protein